LRKSNEEIVMTDTTSLPPQSDLPTPAFTLDPSPLGLVLTDPQIDFLSPESVSWGVFGESILANDTVAHSPPVARQMDGQVAVMPSRPSRNLRAINSM
jgi:hypothetical protein